MLGRLRAWSQSWAARILFILLLVSLGAFLGVKDLFLGLSDRQTLGKVGGKTLQLSQLKNKLSSYMALASQKLGRPLSPKEAYQFGLVGRAWEEVLIEATLEDEVSRLGLAISDASLKQAVFNDPSFQGDDKTFSKAIFERFLRQRGTTEAAFLKDYRRQLIARQLLRAIRFLSPSPSISARTMAHGLLQKRDASVVVVEARDMTVKKPNDATLEAFYEKNQDAFRQGESYNYTLVLIKAADLAKGCSKSEDRQQYVYDQLQNIEDELAGGRTVEEIASQMKLKALELKGFKEGQNLPRPVLTYLKDVKQQDLLREKLLGVKEKGQEVLLPLSDGLHAIVRLDAVNASHVPSLKSVRSLVEKRWRAVEGLRLAEVKAEKLAKHLKAGGVVPGALALKGISLSQPAVLKKGRVVPPAVKSTIFRMSPGGVKTVTDADSVFVLSHLKIREAKENAMAEAQKLEPQVRAALEESFTNAYLYMLRSARHLEIKESVLENLSL